jgi:hypothetical protein
MSDNLRIPPAVNLAFEQVANRICEQAKLDFDTWHLHNHELVTHLQARWRDGIDRGLGTEAAEERALALFGSSAQVAKSLRQPLITRLLRYKRLRTERLLIFLAAYLFFSWMQVLDVHYRGDMDGKAIDLDRIMLPFSYEFFTDGMGTFFVGLLAVVSISAIQWKPGFAKAQWNQVFVVRYVLALIIAFSLFELAVKPTLLTWQTFRHYEPYLEYQGYCVLHVLGMIFGLLGVACVATELLGKPSQLRNQTPIAGPLRAA